MDNKEGNILRFCAGQYFIRIIDRKPVLVPPTNPLAINICGYHVYPNGLCPHQASEIYEESKGVKKIATRDGKGSIEKTCNEFELRIREYRKKL